MPLKPACNVPGCHFIRELFGAGPSEPENIRTSTRPSTRAPTVPFIEETRNYKFTSTGLREIAKADTNFSDKPRLGRPSQQQQQQQSIREDPEGVDDRFWELPANPPSSQVRADETTVQRPYRSSQRGSLNAMDVRNEVSGYRSLNMTAGSGSLNAMDVRNQASGSRSLNLTAGSGSLNAMDVRNQASGSRSLNFTAGSRTSKVPNNDNGAVDAMPSVSSVVSRPSVDNVVSAKNDTLKAGTRTSAVQTNDNGAVAAMPSAVAMPSVDNVLNSKNDALNAGQTYQRGPRTPPGGSPVVRSPPVTQAFPNQQLLASISESQQDARKPFAQPESPVLQPRESPKPQSSPIPIQFPQKTQQKAPFAPNPIQQTSTLSGGVSATQQQRSPSPGAFPQGALDAMNSSSNMSSTSASRPLGDSMIAHRASGVSRLSYASTASSAAVDLPASSGRLLATVNQFPSPNTEVKDTTQAYQKVDEAPRQSYAAAESIESNSLATLEDKRSRMAPQAYFNALDLTSQQGSITTSATLEDKMTELALLVPPLCPALILPQSESRFGMALSELASAGSNATVSVVSLSGKSLLTMRICEQNKLEVYLAMHVDRPRCVIMVPTGEEPFDILDATGGLYGRFMSTALNVHEVIVQSQSVLLLQGTSKTMKFSVTTPSGEPVALARRNVGDYPGGEHFEIRTLPGADTVLVTACLFAIVLFTSPE